MLPLTFTFQDRSSQTLSLDGLSAQRLEIRNNTTQSDLHLWLNRHAEGIEGGLDYRTDILHETTVQKAIVDRFLATLQRIIDEHATRRAAAQPAQSDRLVG